MPVMPSTCEHWRGCLVSPGGRRTAALPFFLPARTPPHIEGHTAAHRRAKRVVRAKDSQTPTQGRSDVTDVTQELRDVIQDQETFSTAAGVVEPVEEHVAEVQCLFSLAGLRLIIEDGVNVWRPEGGQIVCATARGWSCPMSDVLCYRFSRGD